MKIYLIGALKNPKVQDYAVELRKHGFNVWDEWSAVGKDCDLYWFAYEKKRGRNYKEALKGDHAQDVFALDKKHIDDSDTVVMIMPCGKSGHIELGYAIGRGKKGYVLFDKEPDRYDIMYGFATDIYFNFKDLLKQLKYDQR